MAFKYKLVKEGDLGTSKDVRRFPSLSPDTLERMGALVDFEARKKFVITPANTPESEELEKIIRYSLEEEDFDPEDIDNYMEFLYIERNNNIGGEFGDTPLNEQDFKKRLTEIVNRVIEKKEDRCKRIADRRYDKPSAYKSGAIVRCRQGKIWKDLKEDESLHKWFKRQGPKGKEGGWVDCNAPDGKGGYKACGRKKGEKRAKYPSCRPTPSQCKTKGKGKKWGKTK
jgi:hypothetical protein